MKCYSYDEFFKNFSNKTNLRIISALKSKPMSVKELAEKISEEQSKVSHSLARLSSCRLLSAEQKGKQRIYSLNKKTIFPMMSLVEKHVKNYCSGRCNK